MKLTFHRGLAVPLSCSFSLASLIFFFSLIGCLYTNPCSAVPSTISQLVIAKSAVRHPCFTGVVIGGRTIFLIGIAAVSRYVLCI